MPSSTKSSCRVAFAGIADPAWTAGSHYYHNLFRALRTLPDEIRPRIILLEAWGDKHVYDGYRQQVDELLAVPDEPAPSMPTFWQRQAGRVKRRLNRVWPSPPKPNRLETFLRLNRIDAVFATWREFGADFGLPVLTWIPDFQNIHFPELFLKQELDDRNWLFPQIAANVSRMIVSSEQARRDVERLCPAQLAKARVLHFAVELPPNLYDTDPAWICEHYHLPQRFFYLPDQFWRHKNHELVLEALVLLKTQQPEIVVVCSGNTNDNRALLYFGELLAKVSRLGLRDKFILLGWVAHDHIFQLIRQSVAVLQPSLFEGWSTTVEETKAVGKSIVLSEIAVHREQDPAGALYFDPTQAHALADCLQQAWAVHAPGPDVALEAQARANQEARLRGFAEMFAHIVDDAVTEMAGRHNPTASHQTMPK